MSDDRKTSLLDIANNGAALNQAVSELASNVAKLSSIKLPVANGGTGASTAADARTNLGLGTIATQNANNVSITGGSISGLSPALGVGSGGTGLSSTTIYSLLCGGTTTTGNLQSLSSVGTTGQVLTSAGASALPAWQDRITLQTAKAYNWNGLTTNTVLEFTGIPSWAKRITVMLSAISTNGTSIPVIQLGSTTYTTSGYLTNSSFIANATAVTSAGSTSANGFYTAPASSAGNEKTGTFVLHNLTGTTWICTGIGTYAEASTYTSFSAGSVALSGALDRVRLNTVNTTDRFDKGTVNIMYE